MTSCALLNDLTGVGPLMVASDFCTTYKNIVQQKGDSAIKASKPVVDRIAANEKTFTCMCPQGNPQHPICLK